MRHTSCCGMIQMQYYMLCSERTSYEHHVAKTASRTTEKMGALSRRIPRWLMPLPSLTFPD